jgi:hypothetical protein
MDCKHNLALRSCVLFFSLVDSMNHALFLFGFFIALPFFPLFFTFVSVYFSAPMSFISSLPQLAWD